MTIECSGACTVTVQLEPATAGPDEYSAAIAVFVALLGAAAVIWGAKRVIRLFDTGPE
jgi:hypothetical protein